MIETLKKLNKKTLIIIGCIIIIPILLIIILAFLQGCSNSKVSYSKYEKNMISAAQKYFNDNENEPIDEGDKAEVSLDKLVEEGYIKEPSKSVKDECSGVVAARMNGSSAEVNNGGYVNYTVTLECDKYKTLHLADKIKENLTTEGSGLYAIGDEYIFKGDKPNNYINVFDTQYRIMSMDSDNVIKLIKVESEMKTRKWDDKYNVETQLYSGKNIYKDSSILDYLLSTYSESKEMKSGIRDHIVAYDVCVGKRSSKEYAISREIDCSERLDNQVISLINVSDYSLASLDNDCKNITSKSCNNYNYLSDFLIKSWTMNAVSENTYDVFYLSSGMIMPLGASTFDSYNLVIFIDGNEFYQSGEGTQKNPYIFK